MHPAWSKRLSAGPSRPWRARQPLRRLPGDIHAEPEGFAFHFALATRVLVRVAPSASLATQAFLARHGIDAVWHFSDRSNLTLIQEHQALLSLAE